MQVRGSETQEVYLTSLIRRKGFPLGSSLMNDCPPGNLLLSKAQWSSEMDYDDQPVWRYIPPQHSKPLPEWLKDLQERDELTCQRSVKTRQE